MKKHFYILLALIVLFPLFSQDNRNPLELFAEANEYYKKQSYREALPIYMMLTDAGYDNFAVNYNIGNCYFKLDQLGEARFYFEKALIMDPYNRDVRFNLMVLYKRLLENPLEGEQEIVNIRFIYAFPYTVLLVLFILFFITTAVLVALYLMKSTKIYLILSIPAASLAVIVSLFFFAQYADYSRHKGIITEEYANIYLAPYTDTVIVTLKEGVKTRVVDEVDEYVKVSFEDGTIGWVKKDNIMTTLPSSR